jgi:CheY-like chemotaxis protein
VVPATVAEAASDILVMVADDSKVARVKTGRVLTQHRYRVCYANDGTDAARQIESERPDLVITDNDMPGMDGFALTRLIRSNPGTAHIPVIMITAADDRHREMADASGVSVLLGKPYEDAALIESIHTAMRRGSRPMH